VNDIFPTIELTHPLDFKPVPSSLLMPDDPAQPKPFKVVINPADRKHEWLDHVVLIPWAAPQRLIGFVHPDAKVGREPFMLHRACMYNAQHALQQAGENQLRVVEGPKIVLPYDVIAPMDVRIYNCPSAIWMRDQVPAARDLFASMLLQIHAPSKIVPATGPLPPAIAR